MNDSLQTVLAALATKLGTTAEHLYGVLVKQAYIAAVTDLLFAMVYVGFTLFFASVVRRKTSVPVSDGRYVQPEWAADGAFFAHAAVWVLAAIGVLVVGSCIHTVTTVLLNPEYWALNKILSALK